MLFFIQTLPRTLGRFNFWICTRGTRLCPVLSWHHLLFGIRFSCCVLFIKYWFLESRYPSVLIPTYHLLFPFIVFSWCIVVFINNLRASTCEFANSDRYVSQQRRWNPFPPLKGFHINSCLHGFREIGAHAFSPGTCWMRLSPNSFSFNSRKGSKHLKYTISLFQNFSTVPWMGNYWRIIFSE